MTSGGERTDLEALVERVAREVLSNEATAPGHAPRQSSTAPESPDSIAIGADHGGFALKEQLKRYLTEDLGLHVVDCGTHSTASVDYPDIAQAVATNVASGSCARGILIDGAGVGSTMAANKIAGIRCALCHDDLTVINSRSHNDANVLALGARSVNVGNARRLVRIWLETPFEGGRHAQRVEKIMRLEEKR